MNIIYKRYKFKIKVCTIKLIAKIQFDCIHRELVRVSHPSMGLFAQASKLFLGGFEDGTVVDQTSKIGVAFRDVGHSNAKCKFLKKISTSVIFAHN